MQAKAFIQKISLVKLSSNPFLKKSVYGKGRYGSVGSDIGTWVPMVAGVDENPLVVLMLEVPMVAGGDRNPLEVPM
ncbi:MAG: hypothetical protein J7K22_02545 [Nanoarchaeota archaeon]|nr:hypothetical protein [Nanoarchaeota archaeon]